MRRLAGVIGVAFSAAVVAATPATATVYGVGIQAAFNRDGDPSLVANFTPDGSLATPSWSTCSPDSETCTPAGGGRQLDPGPEPPGTVFQASASYGGQNYSARTAPWQGTVRSTAPPQLEGSARFGARVAPVAGSWEGGWGSEHDRLAVEACRTTAAKRCVILSAEGEDYPGSGHNPLIGSWYTGWYLFAMDWRVARDTAFAGVGYFFAADISPWTTGPTLTRSAAVGPAVGPTPPKVTFLRKAIIRNSRLLVAKVRCTTRCRVWPSVYDRQTVYSSRNPTIGSGLVGIPARGFRRGMLHVELHVDDGPGIRRTIRLG